MAAHETAEQDSQTNWVRVCRSAARSAFAGALVLGVMGVTPMARAADNDTTQRELKHYDRYLDSHPAVARDLRRDPNLVNNPDYLHKHPGLEKFLAGHSGAREELKKDPAKFTHKEARFEQKGNDISHHEVKNVDEYLDHHPAAAKQLRKDPSLIDNPQFLAQHPQLQEFLKNHPQAREDWKQHPHAMIKRERRFEHHENAAK